MFFLQMPSLTSWNRLTALDAGSRSIDMANVYFIVNYLFNCPSSWLHCKFCEGRAYVLLTIVPTDPHTKPDPEKSICG